MKFKAKRQSCGGAFLISMFGRDIRGDANLDELVMAPVDEKLMAVSLESGNHGLVTTFSFISVELI